MQKRTRNLLSIFGITLGLLLAVSPFLVGYAQKETETQKVENQNQVEQENKARQEVAKRVVESIFFDSITIKESDWRLKQASYSARHTGKNSTSTNLFFTNDDYSVGITISEYDTAKEAAEPFYAPIAVNRFVTFNTYGDEGQKAIGAENSTAIRFRKGNFFVRIYASDEKTAERFAGYAVESLNNLTGK